MSRRRDFYYSYMRSPEWRAKRDLVWARCHGVCERCQLAPMRDVHHLTYQRLGDELLSDLQGLCRPCHALVGNYDTYDPIPSTYRAYPLREVLDEIWTRMIARFEADGRASSGRDEDVSA